MNETDSKKDVTIRVTRSYGTKRLYGTVYPDDFIGLGFNTRWGGYYFAISGAETFQDGDLV